MYSRGVQSDRQIIRLLRNLSEIDVFRKDLYSRIYKHVYIKQNAEKYDTFSLLPSQSNISYPRNPSVGSF